MFVVFIIIYIYTGHLIYYYYFINESGLFSSLLFLAEQKVECAICTSDHKVVCLRSVGWGWAEVSMVSS